MSQCIAENHGINFPSPGIPGIDRDRWIKDNCDGLAGERAVANVFIAIGIGVKKMQNRDADLQIGGAVEVKTDRLAHKTGRVSLDTSPPTALLAEFADVANRFVGMIERLRAPEPAPAEATAEPTAPPTKQTTAPKTQLTEDLENLRNWKATNVHDDE